MARIDPWGRARPGAAALAAALALAAAAEAGAREGRLYGGLNVPVMFVDDTDSTTAGRQAASPLAPGMRTPYRASSTAEHKTGFKVAGVVGYEFGGGLRVEGELFFARSEVERLTYEGVNASGQSLTGRVDVPIDGTADQIGGFANLWYDIELGGGWLPFVGGGLGFIPHRPVRARLRLQRAGAGDRQPARPGAGPGRAALPAGLRAGHLHRRQRVRLASRRRAGLPPRRQRDPSRRATASRRRATSPSTDATSTAPSTSRPTCASTFWRSASRYRF